MPVKLVYLCDRVVEIEAENLSMFDKMYNLLADAGFKSSDEIKDILDIYLNDNISKSNIIVITAKVDYDLYTRLYKINALGFHICLIFIDPENARVMKEPDAGNVLSSLEEIGVDIYR